MKKQLIYAGALLLTMGFAACTEDFTDWADPQSNPQLDPTAQVSAVFEAGKDASIVMDNFDVKKDSVEIIKFVSTDAGTGSKVVFGNLMVNDTYELPYNEKDGVLKVAVGKLDTLTQEYYKSRASVERELKLKVKASALLSVGEGLSLVTNDVTIKLKPGTTPELDPNGYYLVGDFTDWGTNPAKMQQDADNPNLYTYEFEASRENMNFKFFPAAAVVGGVDWNQGLGSATNEDPTPENIVAWQEGDKQAGSIKITFSGKVKITYDAENFYYTVKDNNAPAELYMTGSKYGWGGTWNQFIPVNSVKGAFWGMYYFEKDEKVKFAPQADWGGDFGFEGVTISQESTARAGLSADGSNIVIGIPGWYLVYVSVTGNDKIVEFEEPNVYLNGDCIGGWNAFNDASKFTTPTTSDGEFVSPAFIAAGEIRICVRPQAIDSGDWWKTEFIVSNGKIDYRGNGPDQARVQGTAGQKVHLKFSDNTGKVE